MVVRFQHTWPYLPAFAVSHACFPRPTMPAGQRTAQLDARAGEARPKGESRERPEESLLSSGRFRLSPATGAHNTAAFQFKSTFLSRRTQVLCFFLDSRKKRNPFVSLSSPSPAPCKKAARQMLGGLIMRKNYSSSSSSFLALSMIFLATSAGTSS